MNHIKYKQIKVATFNVSNNLKIVKIWLNNVPSAFIVKYIYVKIYLIILTYTYMTE